MNHDSTIQFIIIGGDITNLVLSKEYDWFQQILSNSKKPFITIIGNHDYLSNGKEIYLRMFGSTYFSFTIGKYKFICFDNIIWENNNAIPNFACLEKQLNDSCYIKLIIAHIPPWSDEFKYCNNPENFNKAIDHKPPFLMLMGHTHVHQTNKYNHVPFVISGTIEDRIYLKIKLFQSKCWVEKVNY